jgi:hypothetical protein
LNKKLLSILTTFGLVAGLLSIAAPAFATHESVESVASYMPNDGYSDKDQLSDVNDGQDGTAHLTAVADPDATQVSWYVCADGVGEDEGTIADDSCSAIGTDSSARQPATGAGDDDPDTVDEEAAAAFEFNWDIPSTFDTDATGEEFDILVVACAGAPLDEDEDDDPTNDDNCSTDRQDEIALDDSATGSVTDPFSTTEGENIPSGEIALYCSGGEGGDTPEECDSLEEGSTFDHGEVLPPNDLTVAFTTSNDVDAASA